MYTGIVQTLSEVIEVEELKGLNCLKVAIDSMYLTSLTIGAQYRNRWRLSNSDCV